MLVVSRKLRIPLREFTFTFARSGGAGGQNVNKVNSKAVLRWDVAGSASLPQGVRRRFRETYGRRLTQDGVLVMTSQRFRDQGRNVADCLEKLRAMLAAVETPPRARIETRPGRGARQRRLEEKRRRARVKRARGRPAGDED